MAAITQKSLTVGIIAVAVVLVVLGYFFYDLNLPVCARISEEVATSLHAQLDVAGKKGEIFLGKQKVEDLSDESKRYVANLRTCCQVLDAGKLNADQFLQCKTDVAQHETRVTQIVRVINEAQAAQAAGQTETVKQKIEVADRLVSEVRETGALFAQKVAQLTPGSADSPANENKASPMGAGEREPNADAFQANRVMLGATITGEIEPANDQDWFVLRADTKVRDWMDVRLSNRSMSLRPCLTVYDSNRTDLGYECAPNASANVGIARVIEPGKDYYVLVSSYDSRTAGPCTVTLAARKAYDAYEPNNDVFTAKPIPIGKSIDANILEGSEQDWFVVQNVPGKLLIARLENRSTSLRPCLTIYDVNRTNLGYECAQNPSANTAITRATEIGKNYYVLVSSYDGRTTSDYRLTIDQGTQ